MAGCWLVLACAGLTGCATAGFHGQTVHVQGHWTVGVVYSEFVPLGAKTSYEFVDTGLPAAFLRYQQTVPPHADDSSQNGRARSVYMDFEGEVYRDPKLSPGAPVIRVLKLYSYGPPKPDYLRSRRPR